MAGVGILNYSQVLEGGGPAGILPIATYSTAEYRNKLTLRNLPPPVNEALNASGLATYLQDLGNVISIPIWGTADENITIHYDENELLFPVGTFYRETSNVNYNRYNPENDSYATFTIDDQQPVPPNPSWGGNVNDLNKPYPTEYNTDEFKLVSQGTRPGVGFPFEVIDNYPQLDLEKESSLGLLGGEKLEFSINENITTVRNEANPNIIGTGNITPPIGEDGGVEDYIGRLRGEIQFFNTLPNDAVGWQEYNSSPKNNKISDTLSKISSDLLGAAQPTLNTEQRVNSLLVRTSTTQVGFLFESFDQNLFVPNYTDRRMVGTSEEGTNSRYYIGSERSTNRGGGITKVFQSSEFNEDASTARSRCI